MLALGSEIKYYPVNSEHVSVDIVVLTCYCIKE